MVSNDKFKQLKPFNFTIDAYTQAKNLIFLNSFSTKPSGQKNDEKWMHKITYKITFFLQLDFVLNEFETFKILHVHVSLVN